MTNYWTRIKTHWEAADSVLLSTNLFAFILFIGNCWWQSVWVCYAASILPIAIQLAFATKLKGLIRESLVFGAIVAACWPLGEGFITDTVGWWGRYLAPGPMIWHTPVYCMLIGWLSSTYVYYAGHRALDTGVGLRAAMLNAGLAAFILGVIGENLFVSAGMWTYYHSAYDWFSVPAFVPVAYGLGYSIIPLVRPWGLIPTTAAWASTLMSATIGLGFLVGFFPR